MTSVNLLDTLLTENNSFAYDNTESTKELQQISMIRYGATKTSHNNNSLTTDSITNHSLTKHMVIYEHFETLIDEINKQQKELSKQTENYENAFTRLEMKQITKKVDDIIEKNDQIYQNLIESFKKERFNLDDDLKNDINGSSIYQFKINKLNSCIILFKKSIDAYTKELNLFENCVKNKLKRIIEYNDINDELTLNDKETFIDFYKNDIVNINQNNFDNITTYLRQKNEQYSEIQKIANKINELNVLYQNLNLLITEQSYQINQIYNNVDMTRNYVIKARKEIKIAEKKQTRSRFCKCAIVFFILVIIVLIILFLVI